MSTISMRLSCALAALVSLALASPLAHAQDDPSTDPPDAPSVEECVAQIEQATEATVERTRAISVRAVEAIEGLADDEDAPIRAIVRVAKASSEAVTKTTRLGAKRVNTVTQRCVVLLHRSNQGDAIPVVLDAREQAIGRIGLAAQSAISRIADAAREAIRQKMEEADPEEVEDDEQPLSLAG